MKYKNSLIILSIGFVLLAASISFAHPDIASLECPAASVSNDYSFQYSTDSAKAELQISSDNSFAAYTKVSAKYGTASIAKSIKKLAGYVMQSPGGILYARLAVKARTGTVYSNVCAFTLANYEVLDPRPWMSTIPVRAISSDYAYSGQKSLKGYINETQVFFSPFPTIFTLFGKHEPFDLTNAIATARVRVPNNCPTSLYESNLVYISAIDANGHMVDSNVVRFTKAKWITLKLDFSKTPSYSQFDASRVIFMDIFFGALHCHDYAYLDDFTVQKDGVTDIFNFE